MRFGYLIVACFLTVACGSVVDHAKLKQSVGMTKEEIKAAMGPPARVFLENVWVYDIIQPDSGEKAFCHVRFSKGATPRVESVTC